MANRKGSKMQAVSLLDATDKLETIKCPQCRQRFASEAEMEAHKRKHSTSYFCEVCLKTFTTQGGFWKHMQSHNNERNYECGICDKRFTQLANLQRHQLTHTGQKPYSCKICQKTFNQNANAEKHMLLHTGKKPFKCSVCEKGFAQQSNLAKHERMHLGIKPYSCHICKKNYTQLANMKKHMETHTKIGRNHFSKYKMEVVEIPMDHEEILVECESQIIALQQQDHTSGMTNRDGDVKHIP
ncbi:zinc finger protein 260 isoform X1 [Sergentomyia squamirostris]